MEPIFKPISIDLEANDLASWLSSSTWPFHGNVEVTEAQVKNWVSEGMFSAPEKQCFWVIVGKEKAGYIRLFDLDDIGDGHPLFDLRLHSNFRSKGLGEKCLRWITKYFFETWPQCDRVVGTTREDNLAMQRLFLKCGFVKEGHFRRAWSTHDGRPLAALHFGLLREDWESGKTTPLLW